MNKEEIQIQIQQFSEKLYERGYSDGQKDWHNLDVERDNAYKKGLEDAWEAAKKIILGVNNGGLTDSEIEKIFNKNYVGVLVENTAAEVVNKIQEYERSNHDAESAGQLMDFPDTFDELVKQNAFKDTNEVYTNGADLIPVFRVRQWIEHTMLQQQDQLGMMTDSLKVEEGKSCRRCFWDKYRDAQHPTGNPCDSCIDFSNFSPETEHEEQMKAECVSCSSKTDNDDFKVGDEVTWNDNVYRGVITAVSSSSDWVTVMHRGGHSSNYPTSQLKKTGRKHPELLTILDRLK